MKSFRERNLVTQRIRDAKHEATFVKPGKNPTSKSIYRTLKGHMRANQPLSISPDVKN